MPAPIEREIQSPCGWCGQAIVQPVRGRKLRYCDRSCRQRAYELRTAQARHGRDLAADRVRVEPAGRVVERVIQPRHPTTTAAWEATLAVLAEQMHTGRIAPHDHARIRHVLAGVQTALGVTTAPDVTPGSESGSDVAAAASPAGRVGEQLVEWLAATSAGASGLTTVTRLAGELGIAGDDVRGVLATLVDAGGARLTRTEHEHGRDVDVDPDHIADHARFRYA